jgi:DNA-binding NtrC family response regulator
VDFRLICATNRDLRAEVRSGRFREDLFFRLNIFPVKIPPLRERDDFMAVAENLWSDIAQETVGLAPLTGHELALLSNREWPGNVRQLKNVLQRFSLLKPYGVNLDDVLEEEFCEAPLDRPAAGETDSRNTGATERVQKGFFPGGAFEKTRRYSVSPEWDLICLELARNGGNRSQTAQKLGISRGCLNYQIKKHMT